MQRYNPKEIEPKWQAIWDETQVYKADLASDKPKYMAMSMFNYPSGAGIHIGHAMNYTISDVKARFYRQLGHESYHPVGWDAFGLPAENYAIKAGVSPQQSMATIIPGYHKQYKAMGWSNDWSKEIATHLPEYYKWTQWIFAQMHKAGLAYQDSRMQWWCTKCQTVLANEQIIDGKCWRHDGPDDPIVEQKEVKQWFFKITEYADELLEAIDDLDWTESVKLAQKNWIGRSVGAEVDFTVADNIEHFVLLHGKGGSSEHNFFPWIKKQLEYRGYTVEVPDMPNAAEPDDEEQTNYVLENCRLDKKTAVLGHSFGGIVALRLLEQDVELGKVVLASTPHHGTFLDGKTRATVAAALEKGFDFATIQKNCSDFTALYDSTDTVVPISDGQEFATELNCPMTITKGEEPHFCAENEPEILKAVTPTVRVFTTRPDTLFGATFLVLAPEHELVKQLTTLEQAGGVEAYVKATQKKTEVERQASKDKTGVFTGAYALNPVNGQKLPIWIADYVLTGYGTGAIMAVPAHDERDHEFAQQFDLPIIRVVQNDAPDDECTHEEGVLINSGAFDGQASADARENIVKSLAEKSLAAEKVNYKMRDWSVSRQRYWGAPIPIVYCEKDGVVLVPDNQLPVVLPELQDFQPSGDGRSALARATDWLNVTCPQCGGPAQRETDTLDTYICSSWYMFRYLDPTNDQQIFNGQTINKWMPVDFYNGGDHATAHMLYARFVSRFFHKLGINQHPEPFKQFLFNGKVRASDGTAFSKSKGNGVDPLEIINQGYGADALRTYLMFAAPLELNSKWDPQGVPGTHRFLSRIWTLVQEYLAAKEGDVPEQTVQDIRRSTHQMIKKMTEDISENRYNTAIAASMQAVNELYKLKTSNFYQHEAWQEALDSVVACVAPFAPHIADELWQQLGHKESIQKDSWPQYNEDYLATSQITVAVQVNGKLRAEIQVAPDSPTSDVVAVAKQNDKVQAYLEGKEVIKEIYVPGKIVNLVIK